MRGRAPLRDRLLGARGGERGRDHRPPRPWAERVRARRRARRRGGHARAQAAAPGHRGRDRPRRRPGRRAGRAQRRPRRALRRAERPRDDRRRRRRPTSLLAPVGARERRPASVYPTALAGRRHRRARGVGRDGGPGHHRRPSSTSRSTRPTPTSRATSSRGRDFIARATAAAARDPSGFADHGTHVAGRPRRAAQQRRHRRRRSAGPRAAAARRSTTAASATLDSVIDAFTYAGQRADPDRDRVVRHRAAQRPTRRVQPGRSWTSSTPIRTRSTSSPPATRAPTSTTRQASRLPVLDQGRRPEPDIANLLCVGDDRRPGQPRVLGQRRRGERRPLRARRLDPLHRARGNAYVAAQRHVDGGADGRGRGRVLLSIEPRPVRAVTQTLLDGVDVQDGAEPALGRAAGA